jgi:PleD family two-component response regulator
MLTNVSTIDDLLHFERRAAAPTSTAQKVVIINGNTEVLALLETVLDAGHYDVVFVESTRHAYSQIKRVQPHLVILCLDLDDPEGFQVLSMLKLDGETRGIPVLTYAADRDDDESDDEIAEPSETEMFVSKTPEVWMN